jgi:hypothetical protein
MTVKSQAKLQHSGMWQDGRYSQFSGSLNGKPEPGPGGSREPWVLEAGVRGGIAGDWGSNPLPPLELCDLGCAMPSRLQPGSGAHLCQVFTCVPC